MLRRHVVEFLIESGFARLAEILARVALIRDMYETDVVDDDEAGLGDRFDVGKVKEGLTPADRTGRSRGR